MNSALTFKTPANTGTAAFTRSIRNAGLHPNGHAVIFTVAAIFALVTASECESITNPMSLLYGAVLWGWWACVASALWKIGQTRQLAADLSPRAIFGHLAAGTALGALHLLLLGSLGFLEKGWRLHHTAFSVGTSMFGINREGMEILLYGFVVGSIGIFQFHIRAQEDALRAAELQKQLSTAHLRALQMQLEPHFLFNTLNAITTLVEFGRQKEAATMLSRLNAILRKTLQSTTPEKVPLSQELEIMEHYLEIEQVRFADRLRVEIRVEPGALRCLVPNFLLQPIVENAIRHGIAHCEDQGLVQASATRKDGRLLLSVRDFGRNPNTPAKAGHGIGLSNTRERLRHFYREDYRMMAEPIASGGFEVSISIPYEAR